ncbi:MAG: choice-of-anchor A family protein [Kiritimatiellae bacterium]|nr:choice-of-anchor A family protein [Kiritimatiellia bacterium]
MSKGMPDGEFEGQVSRFVKSLVSAVFLTSLLSLARAGGLGGPFGDYAPGDGIDRNWSVWVGGNFETGEGPSGLEGRVFVRGDFIAGNRKKGYVIGRAGGSGVFPDPELPTLVVGGDIRGTGTINMSGLLPIQVGSNIADTVKFIGLGDVKQGDVDYAEADCLKAELRAKSRFWGSLPDTPGGKIVTQWRGVYISADGENGNPQTWVFNLTFDLTSSLFWGVDFSGFEPGDTILVNCNKPGDSDTFLMSVNSYVINGLNANSPFGPKLLWNFPDAAQITLSGSATMQGSILVGNPDSSMIVAISGHDGRFVSCGNVIHKDGKGSAFHNYPFTGNLPDPPEDDLLTMSMYRAAEGLFINFRTVAEVSIGRPMVIYRVMPGDTRVELGRVESRGGDQSYTIQVDPALLKEDGMNRIVIVDDRGVEHVGTIGVAPFAAKLAQMNKQGMTLTWSSLPGSVYDIYTAPSPSGPWRRTVANVLADGDSCSTIVPVNHAERQAFFKIAMRQ